MKSNVDVLPAGQNAQTLTEPRLIEPSSQIKQAVFESFERVPAPQMRQLDAPVALYEPLEQAAHVDVSPTENLPAAQLTQLDLSKLGIVPPAHTVQVADPTAATKRSLHATHVVAPELLNFPMSQLLHDAAAAPLYFPDKQSSQLLAPDAAYRPAVH